MRTVIQSATEGSNKHGTLSVLTKGVCALPGVRPLNQSMASLSQLGKRQKPRTLLPVKKRSTAAQGQRIVGLPEFSAFLSVTHREGTNTQDLKAGLPPSSCHILKT